MRIGRMKMPAALPAIPLLAGLGFFGGAAFAQSVTPTSLAFPNTNVGSSSGPQSLTLNLGTATAVNIESVAVAPSTNFTIPANVCVGALTAAGCAIPVTFSPTAAGTNLTAGITITYDLGDPTSPATITVQATGTAVALAPVAASSPSSLAFGNSNIGSSSGAMTVSLSNSGSAALSISSIALSGANAGDFAPTNNCGTSLAAGGTCTISVTFTPTAAGARSATLTVTDNSNNVANSQQSTALTGAGVALPGASLSPGSLSFGSASIDTKTGAQSLTLTNQGSGALAISNISLGGSNPGDFSTSNNCGSSLGAGGTCTISVAFSPKQAGSLSATVTVTDNANNMANSQQSAALFGTGVAVPGASLAPGSLNFGSASIDTTTGAQSLTLTNQGSGSLAISNISLGGSNPGDFSESNNCGTSLGAGSSCRISVAFSPKQAGSLSATVTVTDNANNASGSQQSSNATGTGVAVPLAQVNPTSVGFGTSTSPQTVTLSNTGTGNLSISDIAISGANARNFSIAANSCGSSLSAGSSCAILITYSPVSSGSSAAVLTIQDNSNNVSGAQQTVNLQGQSLLAITTNTLASGQAGTPYSANVAAQGGASPYKWSVSAGSLPPGTGLNAFNGLISGTATTAGSYTFSVKVTDSSSPVQSATQQYTVSIAAPTLSIQTASLAGGTVGAAYSSNVQGQGGTTPYSWSVSSGTLPAGITLNTSSGALSGVPTAAGTATFTIKVADSSSPVQSNTHQYSVAIAPATLTISGSLPNGTANTPYSAALVAQGGTTPDTWSMASGSLPAGLSLSAASGAVTGTPTKAGNFTFSIKVTDSGSPAQTATQSFSVTINNGLTITTNSLASGTVGLNYTATLAAQSGTAPLTWSITGLLPAGITLDAASGVISGTPTASGTFSFVVKLVDSSAPAQSTSQALTLFINSPVTEPVTPTFSFNGVSGTVTPGTDITNATVQLSQASSAEFSGTLSVALTPNASVTGLPAGYLGDAGFVSSTGTTGSTSLSVPAATLVVPFPSIDPGTVAGSLAVTLTIAGQTAASSTLTVDATAPVIEANSVQITNVTATGFDVELVATSTTRDLTTANFTFSSAAGAQLTGATTFAVNVSQLLAPWFASSSGLGYGGAFSLTIPFTLSGSASAIQAVSVTLTNSVGTSSAVSGVQ